MITAVILLGVLCLVGGEEPRPRTLGLLSNLLGSLFHDDGGYHHHHHPHHHQPPWFNYYPQAPYYNYRPTNPFGFVSPGFPGFNNFGFRGLAARRGIGRL